MTQPVSINPFTTPFLTPGTNIISREWWRFLFSLNRNSSQAVAGEVLTPPGSGLEGGGQVSDGISLSIAPAGVQNAMIREALSTSVIGRFQGTDGTVADIQATADNRILGRFDGQLVFKDLALIPATVGDGNYGDITVSGTGAAWTINNAVVTYAKMQNVSAASRLLGRGDSGAGSPQEISIGSGLTMTGTTLSADGVTGQALTRVDDTNVTLTLGGMPATALLEATSLTLGWAGTLAVSRGGTGGGSASGTLLDNITGFASTGMLARTAAGTYVFRSITGTANEITVANGDGVAGAPTLSLPSSLTFTGKTVTGGAFTGLSSLGVSGNVTLTAGFVQLDNAQYLRGKIAAGTSTRMIGINASDVCFVGSVDATIASIQFVGSTTFAAMTSTGFNVPSGSVYRVNNTQVVAARRTGWTAATGTAARGTYATYTAPTISNPPTQAEVQAIADALQVVSQHQKALIDDLIAHGLIGT